MRASIYSLVVISIALLFASCTSRTPEVPATEEYNDEQLALQALVAFLDSLHNGRYEEATQYYEGTYEIMIDHNPNVDPSNQAALMKNACTINGAQCLEVKSAGLDRTISPTEFSFKVEFINGDGTLFVRGPCCGGNETDSPPQSSFIFKVIKDIEGKFWVMELPPYTP